MSDGATIGWFTLGGVFLTGLFSLGARWMDRKAEERKRRDEQEARREERRTAELAEIRKEGSTALASAERWLVDAHPDRLAINIDPERWPETAADLQKRLAELEEPLGAISVRLPTLAARDLAADFVASLARVFHRGGWLLREVAAHRDFREWLEGSKAEWNEAYDLAKRVREALHDAGQEGPAE